MAKISIICPIGNSRPKFRIENTQLALPDIGEHFSFCYFLNEKEKIRLMWYLCKWNVIDDPHLAFLNQTTCYLQEKDLEVFSGFISRLLVNDRPLFDYFFDCCDNLLYNMKVTKIFQKNDLTYISMDGLCLPESIK